MVSLLRRAEAALLLWRPGKACAPDRHQHLALHPGPLTIIPGIILTRLCGYAALRELACAWAAGLWWEMMQQRSRGVIYWVVSLVKVAKGSKEGLQKSRVGSQRGTASSPASRPGIRSLRAAERRKRETLRRTAKLILSNRNTPLVCAFSSLHQDRGSG